jgi:hypothetical protein
LRYVEKNISNINIWKSCHFNSPVTHLSTVDSSTRLVFVSELTWRPTFLWTLRFIVRLFANAASSSEAEVGERPPRDFDHFRKTRNYAGKNFSSHSSID